LSFAVLENCSKTKERRIEDWNNFAGFDCNYQLHFDKPNSILL